ncbi:MAG: acyl-CoA thioesterase [Planctomycetota bacterium]|nr:MAG: acyl-CoA thioesterase [Planctomycetota bacterium]
MNESLLAGFPVVITQAVVWGEMDAYQHVNNAVYFRYFENARLEYFRRMGWFDYEERTGIGPILAATEARFRKPLTYPDTISVGVRVAELGDDRFTMEHRIVSQRLDAIATEGKGTIVTMHYKEGKKVPIPLEVRQMIARLEKGSQ